MQLINLLFNPGKTTYPGCIDKFWYWPMCLVVLGMTCMCCNIFDQEKAPIEFVATVDSILVMPYLASEFSLTRSGAWFFNNHKNILKIENNSLFVIDLNSKDTLLFDLSKLPYRFQSVAQVTDSLIVVPSRFSNNLIVINLMTETVAHLKGPKIPIETPTGEIDSLHLMFRNTFTMPIVMNNKSLLAPILPLESHVYGGYYWMPNTMMLNLSTNEYAFFNDYPDKYEWEDNWGLFGQFFSLVINNNGQLVYNYPMCHSLYIFENTLLVGKEKVKSRYLKKFPPEKLHSQSMEDTRKYAVKTPKYSNLIYNKARGLYFRVVAHEMEFYNEQGHVNLSEDKPWSIMILDEGFNLIKEQFFESLTYNYKFIIPSENGLWIRIHDSDYFQFFKISEN